VGSLAQQELLSISKCHDFDWSPALWDEAADDILATSAILLAAYVAAVLLVWTASASAKDDLPLLKGLYLFSQTVTTVGLGDVSPASPLTRWAAVVLIPTGLVIVSFGISYVIADGLSKAKALAAKGVSTVKAGAVGSVQRVGSAVVPKGAKAILTKVGETSHLASMGSDSEARMRALGAWLTVSVPGRSLAVVLKFTGVLLMGAVVFAWTDGAFNTTTATDAFFFASLVATTVGYGHKLGPVSPGGRAFLAVYFFVSTLVVRQTLHLVHQRVCLSSLFVVVHPCQVGSLMAEATDIYVNGVIGARIRREILASDVFVHRSDLDLDGRLSEADYILFKLVQLHEVDMDVMARLVGRFKDLDPNGSGNLEIGVEIPSGDQVRARAPVVEHGCGATTSGPCKDPLINA
jgi:hypothetical protein